MTDITDQDRRQLREDAKAVINKTVMRSSAAVSIAQYILANVDAPAPTLEDELRNIAEYWEEWTTDTITSAIRAAADRAEQVEQERDEARAEATALAEDLAGAESEVERLTAVNENLRKTDNYREFRDKFLTVQKGAESIDPADVPPGEAWIVECHGVRCAAVKDRDRNIPWNAVAAGGLMFPENNASVTLITRLVPEPRTVRYEPKEK